ncbi:snaclec coagulation factor IX/factor X-binding protein subunit A-like [Bufo bufo]|uniref:snaclec coagulation factor IX/factor X-binding protein subunit A-like n=1 Tax=Bufo bufo TaxID=8384 RepID=UPI001ABE3611|nr:snaclec coagulation factor IX/factor X-binding protein subunit A-like [Bufo bufo]
MFSLLLLSLLFLQGSLGFIFGKREDSRSSEIQLPFLNFGKSSSSEEDSGQQFESSDDLNPKYFCQGPCKDGWVSYRGYCHLYVAWELSWNDAEKHCQSLFSRAHLTSIINQEHNQFLMALASSKGFRGDKLWTGGNTKKGSNVWADGSPFDFLKSPLRNLMKFFGIDKCLSLSFGGGNSWVQLNCVQKLHFICIYKPSQL